MPTPELPAFEAGKTYRITVKQAQILEAYQTLLSPAHVYRVSGEVALTIADNIATAVEVE